MKTYDSERKELFDWLLERTRENEKKWEEKYIVNGRYTGGQDSPETWEHAEDVREYNRRLMELKKKYGIDWLQ